MFGGARRRPEIYTVRQNVPLKNSQIFSPEGPSENVCGPCKNVSPGPAVALDGPGLGTDFTLVFT